MPRRRRHCSPDLGDVSELPFGGWCSHAYELSPVIAANDPLPRDERTQIAGWAGNVRSIYDVFLWVLSWTINIALVFLIIVVLLAVVARYSGLFPGSLHWATEFSRFSIIWIVMLGSVIAFHRGAHVAIDISDLLPRRYHRPLRSIAYVLSVAFLGVLTWEGLKLSFATMHQISPALGLPMGYAYLAIPVGSLLMTLQSILFVVVPQISGAGVGESGGAPDSTI